MKKLKKLFLANLILILGFVSCDKNDVDPKSLLSGFDENMYYDSEIFNEQYIGIYGQWKIYEINGGYFGLGYEPDFDFFEIKKYGIYGFIRNDSLLEFGKIKIKSQTLEHMSITLERDDNSKFFFNEYELFIDKIITDSLSLYSEAIDGFNYYFTRTQ